MNEKCKTCKKEIDSGIWMSQQFADEKVLLFCSDKCKNKYIQMKLERIKVSYPKYYDKIINFQKETGILDFDLGKKRKGKYIWKVKIKDNKEINPNNPNQI